MFNCQFHGRESNTFCFRAFQKDNINLWEKYRVEYVSVETTNAEIDEFLLNANQMPHSIYDGLIIKNE